MYVACKPNIRLEVYANKHEQLTDTEYDAVWHGYPWPRAVMFRPYNLCCNRKSTPL